MTEPKQKAAHMWRRDSLDWYVEPVWVTAALAKVERFVGSVLDPSCGGGNIVEALRAAGIDAVGSDIRRRVPDGTAWFVGEQDFLAIAAICQPNICMNPPFFRALGAEAFIRHALALASGKVAAFVDIRFLAGAKRAADLFAVYPPHRVWSISPRPSCPPGEFLHSGGKAENGTSDWCWLVWDLTAPFHGTSFGWLRCDRSAA